GLGERLGRDPVEEPEGRADAGLEVLERRLVVGVLGGLDPGEPRGRQLGRVTGDLHLARERELVGREPEAEEQAGRELLPRGERGGVVEPLLELPDLLLDLVERGDEHARHPTLYWRRWMYLPCPPGPASSSSAAASSAARSRTTSRTWGGR